MGARDAAPTVQEVLDSGFCGAEERDMDKVVLLAPMFSVLALVSVIHRKGGPRVLPDLASLHNPFAENADSFEAMSLCGLMARLEWAAYRGRAGTWMPLSELRPGAVILPSSGAPGWSMEVKVPRAVQWCGRVPDVGELAVGGLGFTAMNAAGLDGALALEARVTAPAYAAPMQGVQTRSRASSSGAKPAAAGVLASAAASTAMETGLVIIGPQSKSADAELAATAAITMLEPSEIRTKIMPGAAAHFARFRAAHPNERTWAVLDVVSDRLGAAGGYASVTSDAAHYGMDAVVVTTREVVNEALGAVVASRKRLRVGA